MRPLKLKCNFKIVVRLPLFSKLNKGQASFAVWCKVARSGKLHSFCNGQFSKICNPAILYCSLQPVPGMSISVFPVSRLGVCIATGQGSFHRADVTLFPILRFQIPVSVRPLVSVTMYICTTIYNILNFISFEGREQRKFCSLLMQSSV